MKTTQISAFWRTCALALSLAVCALAGAQQVAVQKVENSGGNATVTTDAANADIVVTALDQDKKPVESWTVRTDEKGRAVVPSGYNLSLGYVKAKRASQMPGLVATSTLRSGESATACVSGAVEGTVVEVKTVDGEVVARSKTDNMGRFLVAGLAAGTYLVTHGGARERMAVSAATSSTGPLSNPPRPLGKPLAVPVTGPAVSPSQASVFVDGAACPSAAVLAADPHEIVVSPPDRLGLEPGHHHVTVRDQNGRTVASTPVLLFEANSRLVQSQIPSGSATRLMVAVTPPLHGEVTATVLNGPVTFSNGAQSMTLPTKGGGAVFEVQSAPGTTGGFQLGWQFSPDKTGKTEDIGNPEVDKVVREVEDKSKPKPDRNSDGTVVKYDRDPEGKKRVVEKSKVDKKTGEEVSYDSYDYRGGTVCRFEQHMRRLADGGCEWRIIHRDAKGELISDETTGYDKDGSHKTGKRTERDKNGNLVTETYDSETNTWSPSK